MKKLVNYFLSFLALISFILPLIPAKVYALANSFTIAYVNTSELSVRTCPSTDNCQRIKDGDGDTIWLYEPRAVEIIGTEGAWSKIKFNYWGYAIEGYVPTEYLSGIKTYNLDANYARELINKGFPESYVEYLCKLHAQHPNWIFEPSFTNVTLDEAVEGEYNPIYKNLIRSNDPNFLSTDPGAYSNGSYVQFEPGWYAPSRSALKYHLDPRNFLNNNNMFMFEQLSYNQSQNEAVVQNILNDSFIAGSYTINGQQKTFASTFVEAGAKYGISPVHLAARVLQEQGYTGSMTAQMDGGDGKYYYNYFNFGASGGTIDEIYNGALNYARASGWDSPYNSIMGSAYELSNGYISNNQDTLYYEKFNIVGSSRYWHQYMANVRAPYSESYTTYRSYWYAGLTDLSFTFKIPVYKDMGGSVSIPTLSSNNNLASLTFNIGTLYPVFDSAITTYTLEVPSTVAKVTINATTAHDKAKVSGIGEVTLSGVETKKEIVVEAEDGSKRTYNITIKKKDSSTETTDDVVKYSGYNLKDNNVSGFNLGASIDSIAKGIENIYPSATVKMYDSSDKEITSGIISTGQKISISINGKEKKYNVVVYGDVSGDGKISAIDYSKVKAHILGINKIEGIYFQAADTSKDGKISAIDYSKVKAHILGINKLVQ